MSINRLKSAIRPEASHEMKALAHAVFDEVVGQVNKDLQVVNANLQEAIKAIRERQDVLHKSLSKSLEGQDDAVKELVGRVMEKELPARLEKALAAATKQIQEMGTAYEKALHYIAAKEIDRAIDARMSTVVKGFEERVNAIRTEHEKTLLAVSEMVKSIQVVVPSESIKAEIKMLPAEPPHVTVNNNVQPTPLEVKNIMPEQQPVPVTVQAPVTVQVPPQRPVQKSILYDDGGRPSVITETPV